jgi:septum formation protein
VALDGRLFGKPADRNDARRILESLTGVTQDVITGITIYEASTGRRVIDHAVTKVTMREMSEAELEAYLDSGEWAGKAGAYGIQGQADRFVTHTEGSFSNVVGLPVEQVVEWLSTFGIEPQA